MTVRDNGRVGSPKAIFVAQVTIVAMAILSWAFAIYASTKAPWVGDLYNLINHNSRPAKPEGTAIYLFGLPTLLALVASGLYWNASTAPSKFQNLSGIKILGMLFGFSMTCLVCGISIHRSIEVLNLPPAP